MYSLESPHRGDSNEYTQHTIIVENIEKKSLIYHHLFVCVKVLRPSQPNGVMSSAVSLPNHTFTGQA